MFVGSKSNFHLQVLNSDIETVVEIDIVFCLFNVFTLFSIIHCFFSLLTYCIIQVANSSELQFICHLVTSRFVFFDCLALP